MSNTFRRTETVVIDVELEGLDTSIGSSGVKVEIVDDGGSSVIVETVMNELGNQKYRYFWDTSVGYTGYSAWSGYSSFSGSGVPVITSGYSGYSGYSAVIVGIFTTTIKARDLNNHYGEESFKIRVKS